MMYFSDGELSCTSLILTFVAAWLIAEVPLAFETDLVMICRRECCPRKLPIIHQQTYEIGGSDTSWRNSLDRLVWETSTFPLDLRVGIATDASSTGSDDAKRMASRNFISLRWSTETIAKDVNIDFRVWSSTE